MAPEIFKKEGIEAIYQPSVDIWAAGIIMFNLLAGTVPFKGQDDDDEYKNSIVNDIISFSRF